MRPICIVNSNRFSFSINILFSLFYLLCRGSNEASNLQNGNILYNGAVSKLDSQFIYYFHVLDSIENNGFVDSTFSAVNAIGFMQKNTGIEGEGDMTYFGTFYFTFLDLENWKAWYEKNRDSIKYR